MEDFVKLRVHTAKGLVSALLIIQNGMFRNAEILIDNADQSVSPYFRLSRAAQMTVQMLLSDGGTGFANAQMTKYVSSYVSDIFGRHCKVKLENEFMYDGERLNDLACAAAEIANRLRGDFEGGRKDDYMIVEAFGKWVKSNLSYKDTDHMEEHSAEYLLQTRTGVCQAIAALAVLTLPYMGIETAYIIGEGKGRDGWGNHSWNAVKIDGEWIMVDFTFGMNSMSLPSTKTERNRKVFFKNHRYDSKLYSPNVLEYRRNFLSGITQSRIVFEMYSGDMSINGVGIELNKPILANHGGVIQAEVKALVRLLGGGCKYDSENGRLRVHIPGRRVILLRGVQQRGEGIYADMIQLVKNGLVSCRFYDREGGVYG